MTAASPLVSVVIPAYNAARFLRESVDSVLAQTYANLEVIVVDDGSTDETPAILESYGERIRVLRKANGGLPTARNHGTRAARGELIGMCDADDLCAPERIAAQVEVFQAHPEVVLCGTEFGAFADGGERIADRYASRYYSRIGETAGGVAGLYGTHDGGEVYRGRIYERLVQGNFVHPPTATYRRSAFDAAGPFEEKLPYASDWDWFVRVSRLGEVAHIDRPLLQYRLSAQQMSGHSNNRPKLMLEITEVVERACRADPGLADREPTLRRRLGGFYADAAYAYAETDSVRALKLLARAVSLGYLHRSEVKVLALALMPRSLIGLVRDRKR